MTKVIEVSGLTRRFGDFVAVDHVSFDVHRGEIFGYLGANGAGKSTTIRMLCGLLEPSDGHATVAGHDLRDRSRSVKSSIGYMSQKFSLYLDLPVLANLEFFAGAYEIDRASHRVSETIEELALAEHRTTPARALPGGIRQRLALGCALLHEPDIVFLDEPTAGVDPASRREFWRLIRGLARRGTTVFVTTHYMDEAEYCGRIGLMVDGQLVALDTPSALKQQFVPGRLFQVTGLNPSDAAATLRRIPGVIDVQPFGRHWHVRVDDSGPDAKKLEASLAEQAIAPPSVEEVQPTLEHVFLAVADPNQEEAVA